MKRKWKYYMRLLVKEEQNQNSAEYIKILHWLLGGYLTPGRESAGNEDNSTNGNTYPQHRSPSVRRNNQSANRWPDDYRRTGEKHIEGKSLGNLLLRKFCYDVRHYCRSNGGSADSDHKSSEKQED